MKNFPWKAVLLDIDGTLLDSNDAHARAWCHVLAANGHAVAYDDVRPLIGKGGDKLLQELVGLDDDTGEGRTMSDERKALFEREFLPTLAPTRGARALLEALQHAGSTLTVATSAGGEELQGLLRQAGVADLIEDAASSSDADASKPDPDIVRAALEKAGVAPDKAVMLGDTPHDIEAARAAGVACIVLRCGGGWSDPDFAGALHIFDDPADLLQNL